jgi:hypothetical protein
MTLADVEMKYVGGLGGVGGLHDSERLAGSYLAVLLGGVGGLGGLDRSRQLLGTVALFEPGPLLWQTNGCSQYNTERHTSLGKH